MICCCCRGFNSRSLAMAMVDVQAGEAAGVASVEALAMGRAEGAEGTAAGVRMMSVVGAACVGGDRVGEEVGVATAEGLTEGVRKRGGAAGVGSVPAAPPQPALQRLVTLM